MLEEVEDVDKPVVMVHDYHLYTLPGLIRRERPDAFLHHFVHIPWSQSDSWRVLPSVIRNEIYHGILANDIIGFHTKSYRHNFLQCCEDLTDCEVDFERSVVHVQDREVWVRAYPLLDRRQRGPGRRPTRQRVHDFEDEPAAPAGADHPDPPASTWPTCPRTSCAASARSTCSSSSTPSSASAAPSSPS